MEKKQNENNCSSIKHREIKANNYCIECKVFMCNKCLSFHSELFQNHHSYNLDKEIKDIFIGICKEKEHNNSLIFFCKDHNQLCCAACLSKIKGKGYGQHKDCEVCFIEDIKDEKKNRLEENIKYLNDLSVKLEEIIKKLKNVYDNINEKKEKIKNKIQNIFTKIRNAINDREEQLLLEVDKKFEEFAIKEETFKESEKLPQKIKISLEKSKSIDKDWNNINQLNSLINDCINIENNINEINKINEIIKKKTFNNKIKIKFFPEDNEVNDFLKIFDKMNIEFESNNFHWINSEVKIIDNSSFLKHENPHKMLENNKEYSLTQGNRNHFIEFSFIKNYFLKSIRIKVADYECSIKTFKVEVISDNGKRDIIGTFIRKKYSENSNFQEFEIFKECKGVKLYLIDNWGKGGGDYILIQNIDFNVSEC